MDLARGAQSATAKPHAYKMRRTREIDELKMNKLCSYPGVAQSTQMNCARREVWE